MPILNILNIIFVAIATICSAYTFYIAINMEEDKNTGYEYKDI